MEETFAHSRLVQLLELLGGRRSEFTNGKVTYTMPNFAVVLVPSTFERINEAVIREIAIEQCEMDSWEYDHWLTNQDLLALNFQPKVPKALLGTRTKEIEKLMAEAAAKKDEG